MKITFRKLSESVVDGSSRFKAGTQKSVDRKDYDHKRKIVKMAHDIYDVKKKGNVYKTNRFVVGKSINGNPTHAPAPIPPKRAAGTVVKFKKLSEAEDDYRMSHRPAGPDSGAPMHDLTHNGVYPHDVYSSNGFHFYHNYGDKHDAPAHNAVASLRGKPDANVRIYRAVPKTHDIKEINAGDWVTHTRSYAVQHGRGFEGGHRILSKVVKAKELFTDGNSIHEWGYHPHKTESVNERYDFASTQVDLPPQVASTHMKFAKAVIDKDDLTDKGIEDEPHVTVKYGLHKADVEAVRTALKGEKPFKIKLGKLKVFKADARRNSDVLVHSVISKDLARLNKKIAKAVPNTTTYKNYTPHATVAYLKPGEGEKYLGNDHLKGTPVTVKQIAVSDRSGKKTIIKLGESANETYLDALNRKILEADERQALFGFGKTAITLKKPANDSGQYGTEVTKQSIRRAKLRFRPKASTEKA